MKKPGAAAGGNGACNRALLGNAAQNMPVRQIQQGQNLPLAGHGGSASPIPENPSGITRLIPSWPATRIGARRCPERRSMRSISGRSARGARTKRPEGSNSSPCGESKPSQRPIVSPVCGAEQQELVRLPIQHCEGFSVGRHRDKNRR